MTLAHSSNSLSWVNVVNKFKNKLTEDSSIFKFKYNEMNQTSHCYILDFDSEYIDLYHSSWEPLTCVDIFFTSTVNANVYEWIIALLARI